MTYKFRRNDVVTARKDAGHWTPYGRVWRRIDDDHVEVIDCGKHIGIYHDDDLVLHDYKGRWDDFGGIRREYPVWREFPSLRKLKQMASYYQEDMWSKPRPTIKAADRKRWKEKCLHAPWTERQVQLINEFQQHGQYRAETCDNHYPKHDGMDDEHHTDMSKAHEDYKEAHGLRQRGQMTATRDGFVCPVCGDTQTYADRYMLLGDFNPPELY